MRRDRGGGVRVSFEKDKKRLVENRVMSRFHRKKEKGKPLLAASARANSKKSSVRARAEYVFAHQENRFGSFIRTIGLAGPRPKPFIPLVGETGKLPNPFLALNALLCYPIRITT